MTNAKGFIVTTKSQPQISPDQKSQLIRKGNELFNTGKFEMAEKIFITLGYSDGISRIGDVFYKKGDFKKAATMYLKAPDRKKLDALCKKMAFVVSEWLKDNSSSKMLGK